MNITSDEWIVLSISRRIKNGEIVVQGLATPLIAAAFLLARSTHAPDLYFASAIGQGICRRPAPLSLTRAEGYWLDNNLIHIGFAQVALEILPWLQPKEFFRPAQVDPDGNFNNIAFGKDYKYPRMRLPGTGGIPDMTVFSHSNHLYVPRHSKVTFVPHIDFTSGLGHSASRTHGSGPVYLVSDFGQFDFAFGKMRLTHLHPGASIEQVQSRTGFQLEISPDLRETPFPDENELSILRERIDPLGIRRLELVWGAERRRLLHDIIQAEKDEILDGL